jgi:hypothetical protein
LFFGALCEVVRALVGMKTWWLNVGMAVLFAATGGALLADRDATYSTPLSLIAWFLMVRGSLDVAVSVMNRGVDRTWGLVLTLGLAQAGLGFFAATPWAGSADPVIVTLGGLCMLRAVADLTTSLRLREVAHAHHDVLALPPERQAGVMGYSAGMADYPARPETQQPDTRKPDTQKPDIQESDAQKPDARKPDAREPQSAKPETQQPQAAPAPEPKARHRASAAAAESFHDEVVRTTADLDTMIANAGVTGTGAAQHRVPDNLPPVPDTPAEVATPETPRH